jgi:hypothetical protein
MIIQLKTMTQRIVQWGKETVTNLSKEHFEAASPKTEEEMIMLTRHCGISDLWLCVR